MRTIAAASAEGRSSVRSGTRGMLRALVTIGVALLALAWRPSQARACAIKHNDLSIVLGMANEEVLVARVRLTMVDEDVGRAHWEGGVTLQLGARRLGTMGRLNPNANPSKELQRLMEAALARARKLSGFMAAEEVETVDCSDSPDTQCGNVELVDAGKVLRVGESRTRFVVELEDVAPATLRITGVVQYAIGDRKIAVVNVGVGDPKFSDSLPMCYGGRCRQITTLHHGSQADVMISALP